MAQLAPGRHRKADWQSAAVADKETLALRELGVSRPVAPIVRQALHSWQRARDKRELTAPYYFTFATVASMTWAGPAFLILRRAVRHLAAIPNQLLNSISAQMKQMSAWEWGVQSLAAAFALLLFTFLALVTLLCTLWPFLWAVRIFRGISPESLTPLHRFNLVAAAADVIISCAEVNRSHKPKERTEVLESVLQKLESLEPHILNAHLTPGNPQRSARRRRILAQHAGRVAARLREYECRVDQDPLTTLSELASLLHTVQERCAEGRVGALLDSDQITDEKLNGSKPIERQKHLLLLATAITITIVGAVGISQADLPDIAEGPAVLLVAILASAIVYRAPQKVEERAQYIISP